jgi:hypothetical protein
MRSSRPVFCCFILIWRDVRLRHLDCIGAALTQIEEKVKCRSLFGAERPAFFELLNFVIGP